MTKIYKWFNRKRGKLHSLMNHKFAIVYAEDGSVNVPRLGGSRLFAYDDLDKAIHGSSLLEDTCELWECESSGVGALTYPLGPVDLNNSGIVRKYWAGTYDTDDWDRVFLTYPDVVLVQKITTVADLRKKWLCLYRQLKWI